MARSGTVNCRVFSMVGYQGLFLISLSCAKHLACFPCSSYFRLEIPKTFGIKPFTRKAFSIRSKLAMSLLHKNTSRVGSRRQRNGSGNFEQMVR